MPYLIVAILALLAFALPAAAAEKPVPEGLVCPASVADAELITTALAALEPGVTGLCVYSLLDDDNPDRAVTMTLRAANDDYDPDKSFKAPKIDLGDMTLVEEITRPMPLGGRVAPATIITLTTKETDLGDITDTFDTLTVFRLYGGKIISLEEEYTNLSADMRDALRTALLAAQKG